MKTKKFVMVLLVVIVLASCVPNDLNIQTVSPDNSTGFIKPDPETFVALMPAVREYFYYRKKAVTSGNIEELWAQFPELKDGTDFSNGINSEEFVVTNYQGLKPFDGNIFPEYYERFKVKLEKENAEILVHGMELYLCLDENGKFEDSGGEFKIVLYLRMRDGHWVVYKTDEVTIGEWQQISP